MFLRQHSLVSPRVQSSLAECFTPEALMSTEVGKTTKVECGRFDLFFRLQESIFDKSAESKNGFKF